MQATRARATKASGNAPRAAILTQAAFSNGVPVWALTGVKLAETGSAFSGAGATNPFELEPGAAAQVGVKDVANFGEAANGAAKLLASYFHQFGSWDAAFEAYNGGPGAVGKGYAYDQAHVESKLSEFGTSKAALERAEKGPVRKNVLFGLPNPLPYISPLYRLFHGEAPLPKFPGLPGVPNPLGKSGLEGGVGESLSAVSSLAHLIALLTSDETWLRLGEIIAGAVLILLGLKGLAGVDLPAIVPVPV